MNLSKISRCSYNHVAHARLGIFANDPLLLRPPGEPNEGKKKTAPRVNTAAWIRDESGNCRESRQTFDISFLLKYPRLGMTGAKRARQTNLSGVKLMRDLITIDLGPV